MAFNVVYYDTTNNVVQQLTTADIDNLSERVLRVMANGTYTGTITVGTTNSIGTFTDTYYNAATGTNLDTGVTNGSTIYTLSQVQTATLTASTDPPMYVGLDTTSVANTVILQENATTLDNLADEILSRMVTGTGGTNAYYLGTAAPSDGATWVSRGTLLDTRTSGTVTITDYKLWQRTTSGATITSKNPLKITSDPLQTFTDAELDALIKIIEQRIVTTGVGTYALQASSPATGTWTAVGTVTDTKETTTSTTYLGPDIFAGFYIRTYFGADEFSQIGTFEYNSGDFFLGGYNMLTNYQQTYETGYDHGYAKIYLATYFGAPNNANDYQGATFGGSYILSYLGPTLYDGTQYQKWYAQTYLGAPVYNFGYNATYFRDYERSYIYWLAYYQGGPLDAASYELSGFLSPNYTAEDALSYTVQTINSTTSSVSTRTLWRRIA